MRILVAVIDRLQGKVPEEPLTMHLAEVVGVNIVEDLGVFEFQDVLKVFRDLEGNIQRKEKIALAVYDPETVHLDLNLQSKEELFKYLPREILGDIYLFSHIEAHQKGCEIVKYGTSWERMVKGAARLADPLFVA